MTKVPELSEEMSDRLKVCHTYLILQSRWKSASLGLEKAGIKIRDLRNDTPDIQRHLSAMLAAYLTTEDELCTTAVFTIPTPGVLDITYYCLSVNHKNNTVGVCMSRHKREVPMCDLDISNVSNWGALFERYNRLNRMKREFQDNATYTFSALHLEKVLEEYGIPRSEWEEAYSKDVQALLADTETTVKQNKEN